jgi:CRISPR-associated endonuclease Csn1
MSASSKAEEIVWAFDLGKGSVGEAVRQGTKFLHKASLLIPAEFAETKTAATRRRMWRTRQAHKAREGWLREVFKAAGLPVLFGRNYDATTGQWKAGAKGDERLEREFPSHGNDTCCTSCLLRIKLLRGEELEPWQLYKAFHSAIQRRGYDRNVPWKTRESRNVKTKDGDDDDAGTEKRMHDFEAALQKMAPGKSEFHFPAYFDAWKMGLWSPEKPEELKLRSDCYAQTTRKQIIPRNLVEAEIRRMAENAARHFPALAGKAEYLLFGPAQESYASFKPELRKKFDLREGGVTDWQGVVGQKIPRFENRIIGKCVLMPRLNVCKVGDGETGNVHPQSRVAAETVFLMKLKNMRFYQNGGVRGLTAREIGEIFNDPKRTKLGLTPTQWKKWCVRLGAQPLPGQYEEVTEPSFSGRSRFCRRALEILKRLILSGDAPPHAYEKEVARLNGNANPLKGLVTADLKFLLEMGPNWEGIYIPNQKLDSLARSTGNAHGAIRELIGSQNDPIVRHRLTLFAERLNHLDERFGAPDSIVLEFVREDFMGKKAKQAYFKFQRDRADERAKAREEAVQAGAEERSAGLKMELLKAQQGECVYRPEDKLIPERLDEYVIDHIVPRAKGGPDAVVNYVLTTRRSNDEKADRTPYEWLSGKEGWDAYVERLKRRIGTLRNKRVQLLTSPDAATLVEKYTALAETAWISKLAQTVIGLRFGWKHGNDPEGNKRIAIVSGGLTGRIRRKYKLNSLLNPDAKSEEEAEIKNRSDDRHHALDAMVISFIPTWARNAKSTGFFRFPDKVHRELFGKELAEVIPQNVCFEKPALAETIYGARTNHGRKVIVQRAELVSLGMKPTTPGKSVFDLKYAGKQAQSVRDPVIRERLMGFLATNPDEGEWRKFCAEFRVKRKDGSDGQRVECVTVGVGEPTEYKDMSKDGTGAYRKALKGHKGQIVYWDSTGELCVAPIYPHGSIFQKRQQIESLGGNSRFYEFFQSDCPVRTTKEIPAESYKLVVRNDAKQKRRVSATKPLPACELTLRTIITKDLIAELTQANNTRVVASLDVWVKAGLTKTL